ncbi:hypothetical protein BKA82DRAFT_1003533 [Pisolithus tinctorius]|uniref:TPX2 C-terminal domain-containing protein n=1 Tax=Pisolithus tinctorius Marx 270 TaxID=870435 RepID=A0A0C3P0J8_PISTI|nr:hypothetical protein BKA82DRAFT_1003533 [Pisolithus tinctorius]KIO00824.1 hypothetical protein M404DRAFT_1003533 [Pisolithus tinctorius Marx 270]
MTTPRTSTHSPPMLTDLTLSQIPDLSRASSEDNLLADDSDFDLLRRDYEQGLVASFASEQPSPRPTTRGIFKAKTNKSSLLRPPSTISTNSPSKNTRVVHKTTRQFAEHQPDPDTENVLSQDILRRVRANKSRRSAIEATDVPYAYTHPVHAKLDARVQSTKPPSTRQTQSQIPRIADTNLKDYECQSSDGSRARLPRRNAPTPEAASLPTTGPVDEILPVHRVNTPTPEATNLATAGLHGADVPPIPAPTHIPTQPYPDTSSPSFPPQQLPKASSNNMEDDEQEELEVADITISIADSDSESTTSKSPNNTNVNSNSIPTRYLEQERVQTVFSPMRRGTKRSTDGNQEAADEGNREEDGEDGETNLRMDVQLSAERDGTGGEGGPTCMAEHETKRSKKVHPQKKVKVSESTSAKTLPAKRTKYVPRSATACISSTATSTSKMTTMAKAGAGGGKTIGAPHLTQLREAHRRLGIAKSERPIAPSGSGSSTRRSGTSAAGGRIGVRPSSRSVSASLSQRHTKPVTGKEVPLPSRPGPSMLPNEREKEPWVDRWPTDATDSKTNSGTETRTGGARLAAAGGHLTKPVPFTFRVDARVRRVVTDPCVCGPGLNGGIDGEKDKVKKRRDDELKKQTLLESDHGESWLRRPAPSSSVPPKPATVTTISTNTATSTASSTTSMTSTTTTVPHPFTFTTTLRATERAKFDALIREKQEEMARAREEARKQVEEELQREVKEMRRRAVPKAHEVPEWYKDMPKRGAEGMGGG